MSLHWRMTKHGNDKNLGWHEECDILTGRGYKTTSIDNKQILAVLIAAILFKDRLAAVILDSPRTQLIPLNAAGGLSQERVLPLPASRVYHIAFSLLLTFDEGTRESDKEA